MANKEFPINLLFMHTPYTNKGEKNKKVSASLEPITE
jgi:hypothetical protein